MNPPVPVPASRVSHRRSCASYPLLHACGIAGLASIAVLAAVPRVARAEGASENHRNFVGGEILGRGLVATFTYERFVTDHFGLGGGFMAVGSSGGVASILPLYVSYVPGDIHSLYLGAGVAFVGGGDVQDFESTWVMQYTAGYQFHSTNGFWVRPTFTLNIETMNTGGRTLLWPGIAMGGSF